MVDLLTDVNAAEQFLKEIGMIVVKNSTPLYETMPCDVAGAITHPVLDDFLTSTAIFVYFFPNIGYQLNGVYFIPDNTVVSKINFDNTPFYIPYTYTNIVSGSPQGFKKHYDEIKVKSSIDDKITELEASIKGIQKQIEYFKKLKAEE